MALQKKEKKQAANRTQRNKANKKRIVIMWHSLIVIPSSLKIYLQKQYKNKDGFPSSS